jgi:hypothetical protein
MLHAPASWEANARPVIGSTNPIGSALALFEGLLRFAQLAIDGEAQSSNVTQRELNPYWYMTVPEKSGAQGGVVHCQFTPIDGSPSPLA